MLVHFETEFNINIYRTYFSFIFFIYDGFSSNPLTIQDIKRVNN